MCIRDSPNAIEPRCAIGDYDNTRDYYTLYTSSQNPHVIRLLMSANVMGIPEHKVRVVSPDVGGGFGSKIFHYAEEVIAMWSSKRIGLPVKWTAERSESFLTDAHGRDHFTKAEMGFDQDGNIVVVNVGDNAVISYNRDGTVVRTEHAVEGGNDGIVITADGTKYVSSVRNGSVSRIRPGQDAEIIAAGIPSAASMCYDSTQNQLVIPLNGNYALAFVRLNSQD